MLEICHCMLALLLLDHELGLILLLKMLGFDGLIGMLGLKIMNWSCDRRLLSGDCQVFGALIVGMELSITLIVLVQMEEISVYCQFKEWIQNGI